MALRPVFLPVVGPSAAGRVRMAMVEFKWVPGMSTSQRQKSVDSLHEAARADLGIESILEISTKSRVPLGVQLSAFNLLVSLDNGRRASVEVAYQASKRFTEGGPFLDLLGRTSREAKTDPRLKESGRLVSFRVGEHDWPLTPPTCFYDWLYLHALFEHPRLAEQLVTYEAFTDIEFNPEKSINCQARAAALYVSLHRRSQLADVIRSKEDFLTMMSDTTSDHSQLNLL